MASKKNQLILVRVLALLEEPVMSSPVVILHDPVSNRILPIWIGEFEARAIAIAYQGVNLSRPLTHNLFTNALLALGIRLSQAVIDKLQGGTYFSKIYLKRLRNKSALTVDARPSDAIALALEVKVPIYIAASILDAAGQKNPFPTELFSDKSSSHPPQPPQLSPNELDDLKILLEKAREREERAEG